MTDHPVGSCTMSELTNDVTAHHVAALARRSMNKSFFTCCPHCTGQVHVIWNLAYFAQRINLYYYYCYCRLRHFLRFLFKSIIHLLALHKREKFHHFIIFVSQSSRMVIFSVLISMVDSTVASPPSTFIGALISKNQVNWYFLLAKQKCAILPERFGWCWMLEPSRI